MWTATFWKQTAERAVKTFAQAALALLTGDQMLRLLDVDWTTIAQVGGLAALVSVLTSIVSGGVGPAGTPSLVSSPADTALQRLAEVTRGLVIAAGRMRDRRVESSGAVRGNDLQESLHRQADRVAVVLDEHGLGRAQ